MRVYQSTPSVQIKARDDHFIAISEHGEIMATLNTTAFMVFQSCRLPVSEHDIATSLARHFYGISDVEISDSLASCLSDLARVGLVQVDELDSECTPRDIEEFVERQVKYRLGNLVNDPSTLYEITPDGACRLTWDNGDCGYEGKDHGRMRSLETFLKRLFMPAGRYHFDLDFTSPGTRSSTKVRLFTQSRPIRNRNGVLWPLHPYHDINSWHYGAQVHRIDVSWTEKRSGAIWRGKDMGSQPRHRTLNEVLEHCNYPDSFCPGVGLPRQERANRFQLVSSYLGHPQIDVGFSDLVGQRPEVVEALTTMGFVKGRLSQQELLKHKYLIVVEGNDTASQLAWALASNSLVLTPPRCWENLIHSDLREWKHYVPIKVDFSDLEETIQWCRENDAQCREIAADSTHYMKPFYQPAIELSIQQRTLDGYLKGTGQV